MIIFFGEGRLGNQVFQYRALRQLAGARPRIVAFGLETVPGLLEPDERLTVIDAGRVVKWLLRAILVPILRLLSRELGVFGYCTEATVPIHDRMHQSGEAVRRPGRVRALEFYDGGYYQNAALWQQRFPITGMQLRRALADEARRYLEREAPGRPAVFVHVRRGDFLSFMAFGNVPASLPESYFTAAIARLRAAVPDAHVVFVSDDAAWVRATFARDLPCSVAQHDACLDFAIIAQCRGGVLSNSSYSLAAAMFIREPAILIAPRYWFGHRARMWIPPAIEFHDPRIVYLDVEDTAPPAARAVPAPRRHEA